MFISFADNDKACGHYGKTAHMSVTITLMVAARSLVTCCRVVHFNIIESYKHKNILGRKTNENICSRLWMKIALKKDYVNIL